MYTVILVVHIMVTLSLIGIILIQRNDSDGAILGGGGGGNFMSGRSAVTLITRVTAILATLFIITSIALTKVNSHMGSGSLLDQITDQAPPMTAPVPGAPTDAEKTATPVAPEPAKPAAPAVPKPQ